MTHTGYAPLVEATRGGIVESLHFGAIAVSDPSGNLLASYGDPTSVTFLRSSAKPFQALPFIELNGDRYYALNDEEVAVICASHSGTDEHVAVVNRIQQKAGVGEKDLLCGTHAPYDEPTIKAMQERGEVPTPNRHNCSGKHTGMLAHAHLRNLPIEDYINPQHPLQKIILKTFAEMASLPPEQVIVGIDGCSAPNFAIPLANAARAYASLVDPRLLSAERAAACQRIVRAMTSYPFMVAGPGRFDTVLMELTGGRILAKGGAEGYQGIGIKEGSLGPNTPALGIAFKVADGDAAGRASHCVTIEILRQLGLVSSQEVEQLVEFDRRPLYNQRHLVVGEIRPHFELFKDERYFGA